MSMISKSAATRIGIGRKANAIFRKYNVIDWQVVSVGGRYVIFFRIRN